MFRSKISLAMEALKYVNKFPGISLWRVSELIGCSISCLENIMPDLKQYVVGRRGRNGGYQMKVPYESILIVDLAKSMGYKDRHIYTPKARATSVSEWIN